MQYLTWASNLPFDWWFNHNILFSLFILFTTMNDFINFILQQLIIVLSIILITVIVLFFLRISLPSALPLLFSLYYLYYFLGSIFPSSPFLFTRICICWERRRVNRSDRGLGVDSSHDLPFFFFSFFLWTSLSFVVLSSGSALLSGGAEGRDTSKTDVRPRHSAKCGFRYGDRKEGWLHFFPVTLSEAT